MTIEDYVKNMEFSIKDRWSRIDSLKTKLRALLFMDFMKKVEALCAEFNNELKWRGVYPETYNDWKQIEKDLIKTIDDSMQKETDRKRLEEMVWAKHYIKYMITVMLIHHLDFSWDIWNELNE